MNFRSLSLFLSGQTLLEDRFFLLIAGLSKESKHVLLVRLDTGLIERIYGKQVSGDAACLLEKVNQLAEPVCGKLGNMNDQIRNFTVDMCKNRSLQGLLVDFVQIHSGKEVQSVQIVFVVRDLECMTRCIDGDNRLKQNPLAVLDVLSHGMKIRRIVNAGRENAAAVLAFRFAEELLPPLCHIVE